MLTLTLTIPPSANSLLSIRGGRRVTSQPHRSWRNAAIQTIRQIYKAEPITTPCAISIAANIKRTRDIDNIAKPTLDALQKAGVIKNDNLVDILTITRDRENTPTNHITLSFQTINTHK